MTATLKPKLVSVTPYEIAALPEWVEVDTCGVVPAVSTDSPQVFNLVDYQMRIDADRSATFSRLNFTILDASRIDEGSQFLYEVVPGAQQLVFHRCVIHRGDTVIDALDADNIRAVQRERELENHIASGRITVELVIDDVRVGDTVDLSITEYDLSGEHPLYGRYFQAINWLSWGVPVMRQKLRIQNESDGVVHFREIDSAKKIDTREQVPVGGLFVREWDKLPIRQNTPGVPIWFWPPAYFVTSDSSWRSTSQHLYNYYISQGVLQDEIDLNDIEGIDWQVSSEATVLSIIEFVQNAIRYRGETDGIYSHTPKPPAKTLKKRSGDCKDKSNLLVALLTRVGVDAQLVLVNTRLKGEIAHMDPSPYLFNHMVVRIEFDGNVYFIDPTLQKQGGTLAKRTKLSYDQALVLSVSDGKLEPLAKPDKLELFEIKHIVDLRKVDAPRLTIERIYYGERADNMRSYFASRERSQYQHDFENYAKDHVKASLKCINGIEVEHDDLSGNCLSTTELYELILDDGKIDNDMLQIYTAFNESLQIYEGQEFAQELSLDGELKHHIHVMYSHKPATEEDTFSKSTVWFDYKDTIEIDGHNLHFKMMLTPLEREVSADKLVQYQKDIDQLQERSYSQFALKPERSDTEIFALLAMMVGLLIAFRHIPVLWFSAACAVIALIAMRNTLASWLKPLFKK